MIALSHDLSFEDRVAISGVSIESFEIKAGAKGHRPLFKFKTIGNTEEYGGEEPPYVR